ncbi:MAG: peroxiredoxin family protein, partial [Bacteroidia bacterium]|nr:peroxiredoxin family protein [Bacteroidia bacterium]
VVYSSFMEKCSNTEYSDYISDFYGTLKSLQPGQEIPDLKLVDSWNTVIGLHDLPDKPTVLYFWTKANRMHAADSHSKVYELRDRYPDMNFVSVNVNAQQFSSWRRMLDQYQFDTTHEFMLKDPETAVKHMALYSVYRVVLLDEDKNIIHPNLNLFRSELEDYLSKISPKAF